MPTRCSDSPHVCSDSDVRTGNPQILKKNLLFAPSITTVSPSLGPSGFTCTCLRVLSEQCFLNGCGSWGPVKPVMGRREGASGAGTPCDSHRPSPPPQVSFFLFIIFVVYTMLPFNMRDAVIASVLTSSSHTVVLSVCLSASPGAEEHLVWQVGASPPPHGDLPRPSRDGASAARLLQVWLSAGAWQVGAPALLSGADSEYC